MRREVGPWRGRDGKGRDKSPHASGWGWTGARAALKYSTFQESARVIFEEAKKITGANAGYVALLTEDGEENEVLFLDAGGAPCTVDPELPMPIRGLRAEAYHAQSTVYENDFWGSDWRGFLPDGHVVMKNVLFAPLNIEGRTAGIMGLANKNGDFTDRDAAMATAFGEFAAIAMANSRDMENLLQTVKRLEEALEQVRTLRSILPICMNCRKVRDDEGYWSQVETYLHKHQHIDLSHGYCPECAELALRELEDDAGPG